jgi:hypothetical protein
MAHGAAMPLSTSSNCQGISVTQKSTDATRIAYEGVRTPKVSASRAAVHLLLELLSGIH